MPGRPPLQPRHFPGVASTPSVGTAEHCPLFGLWRPLLRGGCGSGPGQPGLPLGPGLLGWAGPRPVLVGTAVSQWQGLVGPQSIVCLSRGPLQDSERRV